MKPKRPVDSGHDGRWKLSQWRTESIECHRSNLFCLRLRFDPQARKVLGQENLEREHARGVARDRYYRDHAPAEPICHPIGGVVADNNCRATFVGFASANRIEIDQSDLASPHHDSPSVAVISHTSRSPEDSHSDHASA